MSNLFSNDTEKAKKTYFRHYQTLKSSIRRELTEEDLNNKYLNTRKFTREKSLLISLFSYNTRWRDVTPQYYRM